MLTHLVLDDRDLERLTDRFGTDAGRRRAAILEAVSDRGGIPPLLGHAWLVGTVAAAGTAHPAGLTAGDLLVTTGPATAVPAWLDDCSGWDARGSGVPVRGHAILFATTPVSLVPAGLPLRTALALARAAGIVASLHEWLQPGDRVLVLGTDPSTAALVSATAGAAGAGTVALVVAGLRDAREARGALDAVPVIVDRTAPADVADAAAQALGGPARVSIACGHHPDTARAAVLASDDDGVVILEDADDVAAAAAFDATLGGRRRVLAARRAAPDRGLGTARLLRSQPTLRRLLDRQHHDADPRTGPEDR